MWSRTFTLNSVSDLPKTWEHVNSIPLVIGYDDSLTCVHISVPGV